MPEENDMRQKYFSIGKAAKYLGVSKDTLRRWERAGRITCHRTPGDRRRYLKEDLDRVLEEGVSKPLLKRVEPVKSIVTELRPQIPKTSSKPPEKPISVPSQQEAPTKIAKDKVATAKKPSIVEKSRLKLKNLFERKEEKRLPTRYISTPSGPRRINIRKPKLHIFSNVSIHFVVFVSVLVTTALATILIFYMLFRGESEKVELPKLEVPKLKEGTEQDFLSPVP